MGFEFLKIYEVIFVSDILWKTIYLPAEAGA